MHAATTILLQSTLATAPPDDGAPPFQVDAVRADAQSVVAYDDGEAIAEISMWVDADGRTHIDAGFDDGLYLSVTADLDTGQLTVESDDAATAVERVELMRDVLAEQDPQAREIPCVGGIIAGVGAVATSNPWLGMIAVVTIGCECLPLVLDVPEGC